MIFQFTDDCIIGNAQIDEEHRHLFEIMNTDDIEMAIDGLELQTMVMQVISMRPSKSCWMNWMIMPSSILRMKKIIWSRF